MKSDIILEDYKVKVKGDEVSFENQGIEIKQGNLFLNGHDDDHRGVLSVRNSRNSGRGGSSISGDFIQTRRVDSNAIKTKEILVGLSPNDRPKPGKIEVINKHGDVGITIDGEEEDIKLRLIGSLTEKIRELETEISGIKNYLQNS